jgi:alanine dehydrogenase
MQIGLIKEIKNNENRVALTPAAVETLAEAGHEVLVEHGAGEGSAFADGEYEASGARMVDTADAWSAELVLKVKEPLESEYGYFRPGQMLFTYLHLAGVDPNLTHALLDNQVTAIAYETVRGPDGKLPLLAPMSAVAGSMSASVARHYLAKFAGGKGVLLGRIMGEPHGKVVVIGDGVVGQHAAHAAVGGGAETYIFTLFEERFDELREEISPDVIPVLSSEETIREHVRDADAVIGAVLLPGGARAPHVVSEDMVASMQPGSVIVDVSIDQGGCIETSRPTSHSDPVYTVHDVIHYCVTNMPGAYPMSATRALVKTTLPYVQRLADGGMAALTNDADFADGVNTCDGKLTIRSVAEALDLTGRYQPFADLMETA